MKKKSFVIASLFILVAAFVFLTFGRGLHLQAQNLTNLDVSQTNEKTQNYLTSDKPVLSINSPYVSAATQNANLKSTINWAFGGKSQRGWYIYESLINQLISNDSPEGTNFAAALSKWQQSSGLIPNGILSEDVLLAMVKTWQANRLKVQGYPTPEELLTAPSTDFWDESRPAELRHVEQETYTAYKKLVAAAAADKSLNLKTNEDGSLAESEKFLKIVSAFRSREYQEKLRAASPNSGRAGLAVNSPHFTGRALDIYVGGEPVSTKDDNRALQVNTPVYKWLVKNAGKFGFKPYFYEPWHWEYAPNE